MTTIHKSAIPCDCGCGCALVWQFDQFGDNPEEIIVDFSICWGSVRYLLRDRLKAAWRVLGGRDPWLHSIVLHPEGIEKLREAVAKPSQRDVERGRQLARELRYG